MDEKLEKAYQMFDDVYTILNAAGDPAEIILVAREKMYEALNYFEAVSPLSEDDQILAEQENAYESGISRGLGLR